MKMALIVRKTYSSAGSSDSCARSIDSLSNSGGCDRSSAGYGDLVYCQLSGARWRAFNYYRGSSNS
jgi:hypothetical protein